MLRKTKSATSSTPITAAQDTILCLRNHFLISMPNAELHADSGDDYFTNSVVYLCDHTEKGCSGIVINKTSDMTFGKLFGKIHIPLERTDLADTPIYDGGPVDTNKGFILHHTVGNKKGETPYESSLDIQEMDLQLTSSKDIIEDISGGKGPNPLLMVMGYAAWQGGQLEDEIAANLWLTVPADSDVIFHTPVWRRYSKALSLLGLHEPWAVVPQAGNA